MRLREPIADTVRVSSFAALVALVPHYCVFYVLHTPLLTDQLAEWMMARTPSRYAVSILFTLGAWAKPSAETGALAVLGFALFLSRLAGNSMRAGRVATIVALCSVSAMAAVIAWDCGYSSAIGNLAFWTPAAAIIGFTKFRRERSDAALFEGRRNLLSTVGRVALPVAMAGGVIAVATESFVRDKFLAQRAEHPVDLFPFQPHLERRTFGAGLVRKAVTPTPEFYGMSKDSVDPVIDARTWKLKISADGGVLRTFSYRELLGMQHTLGYVTLRCISNTLQSDLMGTAQWAGIHLSQLFDRGAVASDILEVVFIGSDGHDDSLKLDYAYSPDVWLAVGMNGKTLSRTHGFPLRLLAPKYYGCRNVKWLSEIRLTRTPYFGTWQRLGYTNEPVIHTASHIDRMRRDGEAIEFGGVSFAADRGIRAVRVRANNGPWEPAQLEPALSPYTWTRWVARLHAAEGARVEANAQDGGGAWQELAPGNPVPNGPTGPTIVIARV
jgi:DMSO/TMAO reductase YedYZ molybdopterin-dependent catalytic subunit